MYIICHESLLFYINIKSFPQQIHFNASSYCSIIGLLLLKRVLIPIDELIESGLSISTQTVSKSTATQKPPNNVLQILCIGC